MNAQPDYVTHSQCTERRGKTATWLRWAIGILTTIILATIIGTWGFASDTARADSRQDAMIEQNQKDIGKIEAKLDRIYESMERLNRRLPSWSDRDRSNQ